LVFSAQISPLPVLIVSDQPLARLARGERDGIADHVGLAARAGVRGFRGTGRVIVADHHVLGLYAHLVRGDLRQYGEDAFADLGYAGYDLRAATVVDLGPGSGAIDDRGTGNPVPACRHPSSALAGHTPTPPLPVYPRP
jgi:hypothetical protein